MRLLISLTSPFARMARIVVLEKGLTAQVEDIVVNPYEDPAALTAVSPTGTIPALVRDDGGKPIADTRLICAWLDHLPSEAPALLPEGGPKRMEARLGEAAAMSLTDKSVALVMEKRRPDDVQHAPYAQRLKSQISRAVAALPAHIGAPSGPMTLSDIAIACALGHLAFRHPELPWRAETPNLADWYDAMMQKGSFVQTAPPAGA